MLQPNHPTQTRGRALYEMNLAILKAKGELVHDNVNAWTQLTTEQHEFWEAMAEHQRRAKALAFSEAAAAAVA